MIILSLFSISCSISFSFFILWFIFRSRIGKDQSFVLWLCYRFSPLIPTFIYFGEQKCFISSSFYYFISWSYSNPGSGSDVLVTRWIGSAEVSLCELKYGGATRLAVAPCWPSRQRSEINDRYGLKTAEIFRSLWWTPHISLITTNKRFLFLQPEKAQIPSCLLAPSVFWFHFIVL